MIPAYQPTDLLLPLLKEAKACDFHLVIVNDGSDQSTELIFQLAAQYGIILHHLANKGKGRAIKTGLSYIQEHYPADCVVVTMDADGQHRVSDARRICRIAQNHPEAIILGSRKLKENVPLRSQFGNTATRFVYRISTGQKIWDTQTGLRAFSVRLIPYLLSIPGERYEYEMNVLLSCSRTGIPICEEEIDTIYIDDNASSHFDTVKDSFRIYVEILKFSAASLISFLVDYGLYCLLTILTAGIGSIQSIWISNIGARLISAAINYTLNRKLVFRSKENLSQSAIKYTLLACLILSGNTIVLSLLADQIGMNRYMAKLATELFFFLVSWAIQRKFIFHEKSPGRISKQPKRRE